MNTHPSTSTSEQGFSLLEAFVAMIILTVGLLALAQVLYVGLNIASTSTPNLVAREKAREAIESVHTARDTLIILWAQIRNVGAPAGCPVGTTGIGGGAFAERRHRHARSRTRRPGQHRRRHRVGGDTRAGQRARERPTTCRSSGSRARSRSATWTATPTCGRSSSRSATTAPTPSANVAGSTDCRRSSRGSRDHGALAPSQSGFTLLEMLIAMTIMLVVLAGTTQRHERCHEGENVAAKDARHERPPAGGDGPGPARPAPDRPGPAGRPAHRRSERRRGGRRSRVPGPARPTMCAGVDTFPARHRPCRPSPSEPDLGPAINGQCTDVITILAADNLFGTVSLASIGADGSTARIHNSVNISDDPDAESDNLRRRRSADARRRATMSVLVQVTDVAGQTVTFGRGGDDPLGLNQFDGRLEHAGHASTS